MGVEGKVFRIMGFLVLRNSLVERELFGRKYGNYFSIPERYKQGPKMPSSSSFLMSSKE
jgi:hypothetical protein